MMLGKFDVTLTAEQVGVAIEEYLQREFHAPGALSVIGMEVTLRHKPNGEERYHIEVQMDEVVRAVGLVPYIPSPEVRNLETHQVNIREDLVKRQVDAIKDGESNGESHIVGGQFLDEELENDG